MAWQESGEHGIGKQKVSRSAKESKKSTAKSSRSEPKIVITTVNSENINGNVVGKSKRKR